MPQRDERLHGVELSAAVGGAEMNYRQAGKIVSEAAILFTSILRQLCLDCLSLQVTGAAAASVAVHCSSMTRCDNGICFDYLMWALPLSAEISITYGRDAPETTVYCNRNGTASTETILYSRLKENSRWPFWKRTLILEKVYAQYTEKSVNIRR